MRKRGKGEKRVKFKLRVRAGDDGRFFPLSPFPSLYRKDERDLCGGERCMLVNAMVD